MLTHICSDHICFCEAGDVDGDNDQVFKPNDPGFP